ncbi:MAG: hypothetical protein ABMA64_27515 [Myxococcota bacterium]
MSPSRWVVALALGCGGDKDTGDTPFEPVGSTDFTLPSPPITTTPPETGDRPAFTCFADVALDQWRDGTIDGVGYDGYDEENPTFLLYGDRDLNGNGLLDTIDTYERDADGNELRQVRERSGAFTSTFGYDPQGNVVSYTLDTSSDGQLDFTYEATWDANDQLLHYEEDSDGDGTVDYQFDYTRTPEGFRDAADVDADGDGDYDDLYTYLRDDQDREYSVTGDYGRDGIPDRLVTYSFTDPVLRVGEGTVDEPADGTIDLVFAFVYDAEGRELYYATDSAPSDGEWEEEFTTTYDAEGRVLEDVTVSAVGTPYEIRVTNSYDGFGRMIRTATWIDLDGELYQDDELVITFGGSCP